jgi:hypothetical protein
MSSDTPPPPVLTTVAPIPEDGNYLVSLYYS